MPDEYEISTDKSRFDVNQIHCFLRSSYWAKEIPRKVVEKSIKHSFCFGVFHDSKQVGFARVITDFSTFAYLADVFVLPAHRGRGVSKLLVRGILENPELRGLRRWLLATRDAHGLYAPFGFKQLSNWQNFMTIHDPDVYQREKTVG